MEGAEEPQSKEQGKSILEVEEVVCRLIETDAGTGIIHWEMGKYQIQVSRKLKHKWLEPTKEQTSLDLKVWRKPIWKQQLPNATRYKLMEARRNPIGRKEDTWPTTAETLHARGRNWWKAGWNSIEWKREANFNDRRTQLHWNRFAMQANLNWKSENGDVDKVVSFRKVRVDSES